VATGWPGGVATETLVAAQGFTQSFAEMPSTPVSLTF